MEKVNQENAKEQIKSKVNFEIEQIFCRIMANCKTGDITPEQYDEKEKLILELGNLIFQIYNQNPKID